MRNIPTRIKAIIIVAVVLIAGFVAYNLFKTSQFRITGTTPSHKSFPASLGTIEVFFNRNLDTRELNTRLTDNKSNVISANFDSDFTTTVLPRKIIIQFSQMAMPGSYAITFIDIPSANGERLTTSLPLRVKDIPYDKLNDEEQKKFDDLGAQVYDDYFSEHPVLEKLPYETDKYRVTYRLSESDPAPTLVIAMKFFQPGNNAVPATPAEQQAYLNDIRKYRGDALAWIQAQGAKLDDYILQYSEPELREEFPVGRGRYQNDQLDPQDVEHGPEQ